MSKIPTKISDVSSNRIRVRGYDIVDLMSKLSYAQSVFLILKGELPGEVESHMMEAILVSSIDHGMSPPSVLGALNTISAGNPLNAAIAGGVLAIGDIHGGAIEQSARILQEWASKDAAIDTLSADLVADLRSRKERMPGFGHLIHTTDPRTVKLFNLADELNLGGRHIALAQAVESELQKAQGRKLPINVDGAIAAVISDMGFDWRLGKGFFIISRIPGMIAHAYEEMTTQKPLRSVGHSDYEYTGPEDRDI